MHPDNDWQSWAALAVVAVTIGVFLARSLRRKKAGGCGGGCGCDSAKKPKLPFANR